MNTEIIGHGTWYDKTALKLLMRERTLKRTLTLLKTEMGIGASGFPHIGSLGDAARSYAVTLALREQGYNSKLIAFCDDKDGLRKVPAGLPKKLEKYIGFPVSGIPDPFGCHESYGKHMSSLLLESLDSCGIEYKSISGKDAYESGLLFDEIKTILSNAKRVGEIVKEEVGQERYLETLPYFPVCKNCGAIYTTKALEFLPNENKVLYVCEGMEIRGNKVEGCLHKGEADLTKGEGKLSWKGEFAARWKALDIRFEAYGKDIADSVRINDRICREILGYEPPLHAQYEMFLDKSGKKISKSKGNVFTPQLWFKYGSPQSLVLLMLKRFVGTRSIDVTDILIYMMELDNLEDVYFGKKLINETKELAKLQGLFEYCWMLKPPKKSSNHIAYNMLITLMKSAPLDNERKYVIEKLQSYGQLSSPYKLDENTEKRIEYALNWVKNFEEKKEEKHDLSLIERTALNQLIEALSIENDPDRIQNAIFNIAKKQNLKPVKFFKMLYQILIGEQFGPKLGPYILELGKENAITILKRYASK